MDRSKSSIATGQKRKNNVHYPSESKLDQIVAPASDTGRTLLAAGRSSAGNNETESKEQMIDIDTHPDGFKDGEDQYDYVDFSAVFGDDSGKYTDPSDDFGEDEDGDKRPNDQRRNRRKNNKVKLRAPEQRITIFALRLALIEKAASGIGTLAFLWATVVILGGFATTVHLTEFWVVTVIILAESSRIFSRSHELEWIHLSSKSTATLGQRLLNAAHSIGPGSSSVLRKLKIAFSGRHKKALLTAAGQTGTPSSSSSRGRHRQGAGVSPRPHVHDIPSSAPHKRTWSSPTLPLVPYTRQLLTSQVVSFVLYFTQIISAMVSIGLSIWRLRAQDFYDLYPNNSQQKQPQPNVTVSLNIFYSLSFLEASLFLLERSYWEFRIRYRKLLDKVRMDADLKIENSEMVKQFFYDVYSECLKGSVFDGLEMDLVSYSISWLQSEDFKQQLGGARLLNELVSKGDKPRRKSSFAADALRRLGTTPGIIERLVEMLSWNSRHEEELLREVATIVCRLVVFNRNCSRLVAVPGSMDGLVSILLPHVDAPNDHVSVTNALGLRLNGLRILKYLSKDHKNSLKIGETRGLLSILVIFIEVRDSSAFKIKEPVYLKTQLKTYKKSLQVLGLLASATNSSGGAVRGRVASIVSGLKNLRDVIEYGDDYPELQRLSVEVLYHLAVEDDVRRKIGATGGILRNLIYLFAKYDKVLESASPAGTREPDADKKKREERREAAEKAGETLTRLILQNEKNCEKLLSLKASTGEKPFLGLMLDALSKPDTIASSSAQVLRSVLKFADESTRIDVARRSSSVVLNHICRRLVVKGRSEMYEACLGLGSCALHLLDRDSFRDVVSIVNREEFLEQLMKNLTHTPTTNKYPRIRRYSVELILVLMAKDDLFIDACERNHLNLKKVLERCLDSISEVENFCLFSGLLGYSRHDEEMEHLVQRAIRVVDDLHERRHHQQSQ